MAALAEFLSEARGIKFYSIPHPAVGFHFTCYLEGSNPHDANAVRLVAAPGYAVLGHLARGAAQHLAPLLRAGFDASGLVN